jgi:hypothetical protein
VENNEAVSAVNYFQKRRNPLKCDAQYELLCAKSRIRVPNLDYRQNLYQITEFLWYQGRVAGS